jgi:hypothetical protein
MLSFLKAEKKIRWVLVTQMMKSLSVSSVRKKAITCGTVFFLMNGLKRKGFMDIINPTKADRVIRVANCIEVVIEA